MPAIAIDNIREIKCLMLPFLTLLMITFLIFFPAFEGWEDFGAVFAHLVVSHAGLLAKLRAFVDIFFHRAIVDKLAFVITPFAIIFVDTPVFVGAE